MSCHDMSWHVMGLNGQVDGGGVADVSTDAQEPEVHVDMSCAWSDSVP